MKHISVLLALPSLLLLSNCSKSGNIDGSSGTTALVSELPAEGFIGTPAELKEPQLIQIPSAAPQLLVPEGTVLLSAGKTVTSSDDYPLIGSLDLVTDGDKDAGDGYFVELMDGLHWIQIDLEKSQPLYAIWIWHYHTERRAYRDVIVQISDDPNFKSGVTTIFNNDYDSSASMGKGSDRPYMESRYGKLINAKGNSGRYLRLFSQGNTSNDANHYLEVEVYGAGEKVTDAATPATTTDPATPTTPADPATPKTDPS